MRHSVIFAAFLMLVSASADAQNLISNPGFEAGSIPTTDSQVPYASNWVDGCGTYFCSGCTNQSNPGRGDLFDSRSVACEYQVPGNKWGTRSVRNSGNRYVGFTANGNYNGLQYFGETVKGSLTSALGSSGCYTVSFWASAIDGFYMNCGGGLGGLPNPRPPYANNKIEVVLRKDGDCSSANEKIIYTTGPITQQTWTQFSGEFTLTAAEAAYGYNKVEFRMNNNYPADFGAYSHAVYLDDVSLTPATVSPSFTLKSTGIGKPTGIAVNVNAQNNPPYGGAPITVCASNVIMDAAATTCESFYNITILERDQWWNRFGHYEWVSWFTGQAPNGLDLQQLSMAHSYGPNFIGDAYRQHWPLIGGLLLNSGEPRTYSVSLCTNEPSWNCVGALIRVDEGC